MWLCNTLIAEIAVEQNMNPGKPESWIKGIYEDVIKDKDIELTYLFPCDDENSEFAKYNVRFVPYKEYKGDIVDERQMARFEEVVRKYRPDVIHIFGSELSHSLAMYNACEKIGENDKIVVSIQGMVHMVAKYYYAHMDYKERKRITFRDLLRGQGYKKAYNDFWRRGELEKILFSKVKNVIGRTEWDYACSKRINDDVNYFVCNESLREAFYGEQKWSPEKCENHSIFVSQSYYPLKGFHLMLEAFAEIIKKYPDAHLYTTGPEPYADTLIKKIKQQSYHKYLSKIIDENNLRSHVTFLGYLGEKEMFERIIRSNILVSASSIENSPNSVGEAMMLGVPVIASDVGGVSSLIEHNKEGYLFPSDEPFMIAYYVEKIFDDCNSAQYVSNNAKKKACQLYDRNNNYRVLKEIYYKICDSI